MNKITAYRGEEEEEEDEDADDDEKKKNEKKKQQEEKEEEGEEENGSPAVDVLFISFRFPSTSAAEVSYGLFF